MIQRIKSQSDELKTRWGQLNRYMQLAITIFLVMLFLSSIKFIERTVWGLLGIRLVYFCVYFFLGLLIYKAYEYPAIKRVTYAFFTVCLMATIHELGQILIPHSEPSIEDWITEVAGAVIAITICFATQLIYQYSVGRDSNQNIEH